MPSDLALVIADIPGLARAIRDAHVATPDGRCCVCSAGPQAGHVRHPCRLHDVAVAALAQIIEQAERATTGLVHDDPWTSTGGRATGVRYSDEYSARSKSW